MTLTIQIVTKNNEDTIEKCIQSLLPLNAIIAIADIGSSDKTINICKKFKITTNSHLAINDYSALRNKLLKQSKTDWQMYIQPYEFLAAGHDEIKEIISSKNINAFYFKIAQGTIISKEIRLWNNINNFVNPCYETLKVKIGLESQNCLIYSNQGKIDLNERLVIVDNWKKMSPMSSEPYYYQSLTLLLKGEYHMFAGLADHYLFKEKDGQASVMLRYYLAMVQAYHLDLPSDAIKNVLTCIGVQPLMAEFWCLLGDIHYKIKQYEKAINFYENALILGSQRLQSDKWPIDVSKYKEHPNKMIDSSNKIMAETKIYRSITT